MQRRTGIDVDAHDEWHDWDGCGAELRPCDIGPDRVPMKEEALRMCTCYV